MRTGPGDGAAAGGAATLAYLQSEIEDINCVTAPRVGDFLVGREGARAAGAEPLAPEALLVRQDREGLALGLFLDDSVLGAAQAADPHHPRPQLTRRGLMAGLACAAEGVSHFVYLATRAEAGRPVSRLELEVQAEVDTFAVLLLHLWRRGLRRLSPSLRRRLFERVRYHDHLDAEALERYRTANRLGSGYARWLEGRFVGEANAEGLLRELRASYRLGGGEKLGHLAARGLHGGAGLPSS